MIGRTWKNIEGHWRILKYTEGIWRDLKGINKNKHDMNRMEMNSVDRVLKIHVWCGFSSYPRKAFSKNGFSSSAYDIVLDKQHDITSREGSWILLDYALQCLGMSRLILKSSASSIFIHKPWKIQKSSTLHLNIIINDLKYLEYP